MLTNGICSAIGGLCGNPFPVTVYVGHAGWKEVGAGIGYSIASSAGIFLLSIFSLMGLLLAVIPIAAIVPMLVFIAIVTGHQAVKNSQQFKIPVIFVCFFPWVLTGSLLLLIMPFQLLVCRWGLVPIKFLHLPCTMPDSFMMAWLPW
jgi:adenine/guanine/hypoxanthine permease